MTPEAPTTIPPGADYREAEAIARKMSDPDLLRLARSLSADRCHAREIAANHEVNRRFERLRDRTALLHRSLDGLKEKHDALQKRFDKMLTVLQRVLALLAGPEAWPNSSARPGSVDPGEAGAPGAADIQGAAGVADVAAVADVADVADERRPLAG